MGQVNLPETTYNKKQGTIIVGFFSDGNNQNNERNKPVFSIVSNDKQKIIKITEKSEIKIWTPTKESSLNIINQTNTNENKEYSGYNILILTYNSEKTKIIDIKNNNIIEFKNIDIEGNIFIDNDHQEIYHFIKTYDMNVLNYSNDEIQQLIDTYKNKYFNNNTINYTKISNNTNILDGLLDERSVVFSRLFIDSTITYRKSPFLEVPNAPLDQSPILLKSEIKDYNRIYFFDNKTGKYKLNNKETFIINEYLGFELSYENINLEYPLIIYIEDELFENWSIKGNMVFLHMSGWQHELYYGKKVTIEYQIETSYYVEYNEKSANYSYLFKTTEDDYETLTITQEGNSESLVKLMTEVDLNPIVNSQHTGFLYVDYSEQEVKDFRLNVSSSYLVMDGLDSADFIIEAIDQNGNEVLSPYLDVFITDKHNNRQNTYGILTPIINLDTLKARNYSGRVYYKYITPKIQKGVLFKDELFLNVIDRKSGLGSQISLKLKMPIVNNNHRQTTNIHTPVEASLPFEYFARYFEKKLPAGHPLEMFLVNTTLDYDAWLKFYAEINNRTLMNSLTKELEKEAL